jgi:hypothetical protein
MTSNQHSHSCSKGLSVSACFCKWKQALPENGKKARRGRNPPCIGLDETRLLLQLLRMQKLGRLQFKASMGKKVKRPHLKQADCGDTHMQSQPFGSQR